MAPTSSSAALPNGLERIRAEFLTALHFGRLRPGDRVPSVRRLADLTGLNRKTVHRAYRRLAREGLLELRPGSGTFLSESHPDRPPTGQLMSALRRCQAEASALGVHPQVFSRALDTYHRSDLTGLKVAVCECNREQIGLIRRDLHEGLGIESHPVLLDRLTSDPHWISRAAGMVTTECHRQEVEEVLAPTGLPVYAVTLDPVFPKRIVERAARGPLAMVVCDESYARVFHHLLRQMGVGTEIVRRIRVVDPASAPALLRRGTVEAVYVSPTVEDEVPQAVLRNLARLDFRRHLAASCLDRLKAQLAFDLAFRSVRH